MLSFSVDRRVRRVIDAYEVHRRVPVDIEGLALRMGWMVHYQHHLSPIYGIASCQCGQLVMVINADISRAWQRATIAHELSHWIAGHLRDGERVFSEMDAPLEDHEEDANTIAAALLIPRTVLQPEATRIDIMTACDVPLALVRHRLYML